MQMINWHNLLFCSVAVYIVGKIGKAFDLVILGQAANLITSRNFTVHTCMFKYCMRCTVAAIKNCYFAATTL